MKRLLILGAGQYGYVAKETAEAMCIYESIEFLDDCSEKAIGKLSDIDQVEYDEAFIAIGNPQVREEWMPRVKKLATLIHPKSILSPSAVIGNGCIIEAGAVIMTDVRIGDCCIIMANSVVGHNAKVGNYCKLKYNCTIAENSVVPDKSNVLFNEVFKAD